MDTFITLIVASLFLALFVLKSWWASAPRGKTFPLANDNPLTVGEHTGARVTYTNSSAPITAPTTGAGSRFLLVIQGSADNICANPTSTLQQPIGVCTDEPATTTDVINVQLLGGCDKTVKIQAAGAIAAGAPVVTNGNGQIKALPTTAGSYWCVGYAVTTTSAAGDLCEVQPMLYPLSVGVVT